MCYFNSRLGIVLSSHCEHVFCKFVILHFVVTGVWLYIDVFTLRFVSVF